MRTTLEGHELRHILSKFTLRHVKKGVRLLSKGRLATQYYFVRKGCLRIYHAENGREVTGWLATENVFFAEIKSITTGKPTDYSIEAIEDCELDVISTRDMDKLYLAFPRWQEFGRKVWQEAFSTLITRVDSYQADNAETRYEKLVQHPELLMRVPLKYLATYLGVTATSLSRLRKQVKRR